MIKFDGLDGTFDVLQEIVFEKTFYGEDGSATPLEEDDLREISLAALIDDNANNNEYFGYDFLFDSKTGSFPGMGALISLFGKPYHKHTAEDYENLGRTVFALIQENMEDYSRALYRDYLFYCEVGDIDD